MAVIFPPNRDWGRLRPGFAVALGRVVARMGVRTGVKWRLVEGYRSPGRQLWLFASGRTRPGAVVTWMRRARWHGRGLAGDVAPVTGYRCPDVWWEWLREEGAREGLTSPAFARGDRGHLQGEG